MSLVAAKVKVIERAIGSEDYFPEKGCASLPSLEELLSKTLQNSLKARATITADIKSREQSIQELNEQRKRLATEASNKKAQVRSSRQRATDIESELDSLNQQLEELERQKSELVEKIIVVQESHEGFLEERRAEAEEVHRIERDIQRAEKTISSIEHEIDELRDELKGLGEKIRTETSMSLIQYNKEIESQLLSIKHVAPEKEKSKQSLESLLRARKENQEIRSMWEAREEWKGIQDTSNIPQIKETAKREIESINARIEETFPGALSAEVNQEGDDTIVELFYLQDDDDYYVVFLPISEHVWQAIQEGKNRDREELAAKVFWSFAQAGDANYEFRYGSITLVVKYEPEELSLELEFPTNKVEFIVSELPEAIQEAIIR